MHCIVCWNTETKVLDSRLNEEGTSIKRRRECLNCSNRFNTYEKYEKVSILVEKTGWILEEFNEEKLYESILKAFNKRNISIKMIDWILYNIVQKLLNKRKISSSDLWSYVLEELKKVDEIAYIRYASVYYKFEDAKDYLDFIHKELQK